MMELFKGFRKAIALFAPLICYFMLDIIIKIIDLLFYNSFYTHIYTGNSFKGVSLGSTIPAIITLAFLLFSNKYFSTMNIKSKILFNGSYIWTCIRILSMFVGIAVRIADMLCIYPILFIPTLLNRIQDIFKVKGNYYKIKFCLLYLVTIVLVIWVWFIMRYSPYNPYQFVWE